MFVKDEKGNYTGEIRHFEPDNLATCLARIINERQDWGYAHGIALHFPGDILYDMEFIRTNDSKEFILQICEYGTKISEKSNWNRAKGQWKYYTNGHKLIGIFLIRKEEDEWRIEEIHVDGFINKIKEDY